MGISVSIVVLVLTGCSYRGLYRMAAHSTSTEDTTLYLFIHIFIHRDQKICMFPYIMIEKVHSRFIVPTDCTLDFFVNFQLNCKYIKEDGKSEMLMGFVYLGVWVFFFFFVNIVNSKASHITIYVLYFQIFQRKVF